jgi:hypothetical protein
MDSTLADMDKQKSYCWCDAIRKFFWQASKRTRDVEDAQVSASNTPLNMASLSPYEPADICCILELPKIPEMLQLSAHQLDQIRSAFELFDTDGNGSMDEEELDAAMLGLGFEPAARQRASKRRSMGNMGACCLDLEKFTALMQRELSQQRISQEITDAFKNLVLLGESTTCKGNGASEVLSCNDQKFITLEILQIACRRIRLHLDQDELQQMISVRCFSRISSSCC